MLRSTEILGIDDLLEGVLQQWMIETWMSRKRKLVLRTRFECFGTPFSLGTEFWDREDSIWSS